MRINGHVIGAPTTTAVRRSVILRADGSDARLTPVCTKSAAASAAAFPVSAMAPTAPRPSVLKNDRRLTSRGVSSSMLRTAGFMAPSLSVGRCSLCPMRKILLALVGFFGFVVIGAAVRAEPKDWIMYVGTYTKAPSKGIYAYRFQGATGEVTPMANAG